MSAVGPRPTNPLVSIMLTDYYQITMVYVYWKHNRHEEPACFELFFRKNPFSGEFTVCAGLEEVLRFVEHLQFSREDVDYLRSMLPNAEGAFFEWLESLDTSGLSMYAIREGTVVFPAEPLLRVHGPLGLAQLLETPLLNLVNFGSLCCTNAARFRLAAPPSKSLFEFGARRAQGPDGALSASRYAYVGGFDATSNVLAGKLLGLPVSGTHSHAFVQAYNSLEDSLPEDTKLGDVDIKRRALAWRAELGYETSHDGELAAFIAYALAFPRSFVALVDTYSTLETGLPNFVCVAVALSEAGYKPLAVRIDSGDLAYLSRCARKLFDRIALDNVGLNFLKEVKIVASNDINEEVLLSLREQDHNIDAFGIGTHLVTCQNQPALGCVYKLVEINGEPTYKISNDTNKSTIPCAKAVYRLVSADGKMLLDLLAPANDAPPEVGERILCRHPYDYQKRVFVIPSTVISLHHLVFEHPPKKTDSPRLSEESRKAAAAPESNGDNATRRKEEKPSYRVGPRPTLDDIKHRVAKQLTLVRDDILRQVNPCPYKISLTTELYEFFLDIRQQNQPIVELA